MLQLHQCVLLMLNSSAVFFIGTVILLQIEQTMLPILSLNCKLHH